MVPCFCHGFCSPVCIGYHWPPPNHKTRLPTLYALIALHICSLLRALKRVFCIRIYYFSLRLPSIKPIVFVFCCKCFYHEYCWKKKLYRSLLLPIINIPFTLKFELYLLLTLSIEMTLNRRSDNQTINYQSLLYLGAKMVIFCRSFYVNNYYIFIASQFRVLFYLNYLQCFMTRTRLIICTRSFLFLPLNYLYNIGCLLAHLMHSYCLSILLNLNALYLTSILLSRTNCILSCVLARTHAQLVYSGSTTYYMLFFANTVIYLYYFVITFKCCLSLCYLRSLSTWFELRLVSFNSVAAILLARIEFTMYHVLILTHMRSVSVSLTICCVLFIAIMILYFCCSEIEYKFNLKHFLYSLFTWLEFLPIFIQKLIVFHL